MFGAPVYLDSYIGDEDEYQNDDELNRNTERANQRVRLVMRGVEHPYVKDIMRIRVNCWSWEVFEERRGHKAGQDLRKDEHKRMDGM